MSLRPTKSVVATAIDGRKCKRSSRLASVLTTGMYATEKPYTAVFTEIFREELSKEDKETLDNVQQILGVSESSLPPSDYERAVQIVIEPQNHELARAMYEILEEGEYEDKDKTTGFPRYYSNGEQSVVLVPLKEGERSINTWRDVSSSPLFRGIVHFPQPWNLPTKARER